MKKLNYRQRFGQIAAIVATIVAGTWQSQGAMLTFDDIAVLPGNTGVGSAFNNLINEGFNVNGASTPTGNVHVYNTVHVPIRRRTVVQRQQLQRAQRPQQRQRGLSRVLNSGANFIWGDGYGTESFNSAATPAGQTDTNWKTAIGTTSTATVTKYGGGTFTFNSAYLNLDSTTVLTVQVNGYGASGLLDSATVTVPGYGYGPVQFTANWTGLTSLQISGFNASIDNLELDDPVPVPEASTTFAGALALLPLGASTLRILRKRHAA